MAPRIGVTGGIGSGKSTVAALLVRRGASLIDVDGISISSADPQGAAIAEIEVVFSSSVLTAQEALGCDGLNTEQVQQTMDCQTPLLTRLGAADVVLFNEGLSMERPAAPIHDMGRNFGL